MDDTESTHERTVNAVFEMNGKRIYKLLNVFAYIR
jgi:hypothetical protein